MNTRVSAVDNARTRHLPRLCGSRSTYQGSTSSRPPARPFHQCYWEQGRRFLAYIGREGGCGLPCLVWAPVNWQERSRVIGFAWSEGGRSCSVWKEICSFLPVFECSPKLGRADLCLEDKTSQKPQNHAVQSNRCRGNREKRCKKKKKKKVDGTAESAASGTRTPASKVSTLAFCS